MLCISYVMCVGIIKHQEMQRMMKYCMDFHPHISDFFRLEKFRFLNEELRFNQVKPVSNA